MEYRLSTSIGKQMTNVRTLGLLALLSFTCLAVTRASDAPAVKMTLLRLPNGLRVGLIGEHLNRPSPTLFVLQGSLDVGLRQPIYTEVARIMAKHGYMSVMIDAPAHGEDHRPGEPDNELAAWRERLERNEDFIGEFTGKARQVLDYLVAQNYADPTRVAACGTSRGAFLAFHFGAAEPRIRCVGGIAVLSDLLVLKEFQMTTRRARASALSLTTLVPKIMGKPAWIGIGNNDSRVGTDEVIAFTRALVKATAGRQDAKIPVPVDLLVNSSAGHDSNVSDHEQLAAWLLKQF